MPVYKVTTSKRAPKGVVVSRGRPRTIAVDEVVIGGVNDGVVSQCQLLGSGGLAAAGGAL